ncbi:uncharacterized protein TRIADDRAFT_1002, partial [Trichoplax adhaerens]
GCFCFRPSWLQIFNHRKFLAFLVGMCQLTYSIITSGYDSSIVSTLQKGFGLTSFDIGGLAACFSVSQAFFGVLIAHKGAHAHKGKWIGVTVIMTGLGCYIYMLPHFLINSYSVLDSYSGNNSATDLCSLEKAATVTGICGGQIANKSLYIALFAIGFIVIGAGTSVMRTLGWSYLDENVSPTISPAYTAYNLSMIGLGTALGFAVGGVAINIYGEWPTKLPDPTLTPESPSWIGAWWVGYAFAGTVCIILAIPLLGMPRHLPNYERYKEKRILQAVGKSRVDKEYGKSFKDLIPAVKELICNLPFLFTVLSLVGHLIVLASVGVFFPKYIETQYGITAGTANIYSGVIVIAGMLIGVILGGWVFKLRELKVLALAKLACISAALSILTAVGFLIARCPSTEIAGINAAYDHKIVLLVANLTATCNSNCHCNSVSFKPVCDRNLGKVYFSPCHAGCLSKTRINRGSVLFEECNCLSKTVVSTPAESDNLGQTILGYCPSACKALPAFIAFGVLFSFLVYCSFIPSFQIVIRCVPESQRALALAVQWVFIQFLASTPGPILLGYFIDSACMLWNEDCGSRQFCWIYDNTALA